MYAVDELGSGQVALISAVVEVPGDAVSGETEQLLVTAKDVFSEVGLERDAVIDFVVVEATG